MSTETRTTSNGTQTLTLTVVRRSLLGSLLGGIAYLFLGILAMGAIAMPFEAVASHFERNSSVKKGVAIVEAQNLPGFCAVKNNDNSGYWLDYSISDCRYVYDAAYIDNPTWNPNAGYVKTTPECVKATDTLKATSVNDSSFAAIQQAAHNACFGGGN